ncbi:MAG: hypothetical protein IH965_14300 [Gemmatimonadetes bacterium]|nr:hypothetical protein [Gemmatimonadota bacterium]
MGAIANRGTKLRSVVTWAREHTAPTDRIMAAGYFCTDLPNRAYAHYYLARTPEQLLESIEEYEIDYVIYDNAEWDAELRTTLSSHFPEVRSWPFGAVYRTSSDSRHPTEADTP